MISKKKFKKLADKHLTAIERPRNEFGRNEIKIYGLDELYEAINYSQCCTQLPTIIEIDFDGHLKCQIETTDKAPTILKAVNGYGQPVDCNKDKIRINEI